MIRILLRDESKLAVNPINNVLNITVNVTMGDPPPQAPATPPKPEWNLSRWLAPAWSLASAWLKS